MGEYRNLVMGLKKELTIIKKIIHNSSCHTLLWVHNVYNTV